MKSLVGATARNLALIALLGPAFAAAQDAPPDSLSPYVVTATRTRAAANTVGSAFEAIDADDSARRQLPLLQEALGGVPGAPVAASGAPGAVASLFLRGSNSNQALFLVDGIRFNDPNTDYAVALGGASPGAGDALEVVRGPQSTLYGADAIGGVVSLAARRGAGPAGGEVSFETGTFGTWQGAVNAQAGDAREAWSFSASGGHTDNQRANNALDRANYSLRVDRTLSDAVAVGGTWRGFLERFGDPGDRYTDDPDNRDRESNQLATVFADFGRGTVLASHAVLGAQDRRYESDNPGPDGDQVTVVKNRRAVLDWQTTWAPEAAQRLTAGVTGEVNRTVNNGFGDIDRRERLWAVFAEEEWSPAAGLHLTGGLRHDDFDTFGGATTGRVTAAWLADGSQLKLRSSYGTGFRAPGFLDLYGQSAFYVGNPNLRPETARGWDAGADYYLADRRGTLSASWFRTDLSDLITYDFNVFPSTVFNVERARTSGVELAGKFDLPGRTKIRLAYTYLDAENLSEQSRLLRRPRHSGSLDVWREFAGGFSCGAGAVFAADRQDVDAATYLTVDAPSFTVVRVYGAWQATPRLALKARVENLFNRKYEPVNGYPALGAAAYGGVEWKF